MKFTSFSINVILVNFVSKNEELLFVSEFKYILYVFFSQNTSCRVAWIDNNDGPWVDTLTLCVIDGSFQFGNVQSPILRLIQVVTNLKV